MKVVKKVSMMLLMCLSLVMIVPSILPENPYEMTVQAASKVKLNKKTAYILKGETVKLSVSGTSKKVKWSTSSRKIATVSGNGVVKGLKRGTVTITAKVGGKKYTCRVIVEDPSISKKTTTLKVGKTITLKMQNTKQKVTWSTSNRKIATVTQKGVVKGIKKGSAVITAKVGKKKFTCKVTVKEVTVPQNVITYIGDRDVDYDASIQSHRIFFSLILQDRVTRVSSSGTLVVMIRNDAGEIVYNKNIRFTKDDFDYWVYDYTGEEALLCCIEIPSSAINEGKVSTGTLFYQVVLPNGLSTTEYRADVDHLPQGDMTAANMETLKNYILKNGMQNSDGNYFIRWLQPADGMAHGIVYDSANNEFTFVYTSDDGDVKSSLNMHLGFNNDGTVSARYVISIKSSSIAYIAETEFEMEDYDLDQSVHFDLVNGTPGVTESNIQNLSNAELKLAFNGWEYLMLTEVNLLLSDIGFSSY